MRDVVRIRSGSRRLAACRICGQFKCLAVEEACDARITPRWSPPWRGIRVMLTGRRTGAEAT